MRRFEYKMDHKVFSELAPSTEVNNRVTWLNSLGADGWQLIQVRFSNNTDYTETHLHVILMREVDT